MAASVSAWTFLAGIALELAGVVTIDLTSHQSYSDLMIVTMTRGTYASGHETLSLRFNGDTGNNYNREISSFSGDGTSVVVDESLAQSALPIGLIPGTADAADFYSVSEVFIPAYAGPFKKLVTYSTYSVFATTTGNSERSSGGGFWNNVDAITEISAQGVNLADLAADSTARVYGRQ